MVRIPAVVDAACLIGLERISRLDILPQILEPIFATPTVIAEFGSTPAWVRVETPANRGLVAALNLAVDPGEASAIALAMEKGIRVILDDEKGRQTARNLGLQVTGTFGLLLKAKESGVIPSVKPLLDALDAAGFHSSLELRQKVLAMAGE